MGLSNAILGGHSSTNRALPLALGTTPVAAVLLGLNAYDPLPPTQPAVNLVYLQTHQTALPSSSVQVSLDEELRIHAANAFASLLAAQSDTDPDIARIVGEFRSELYALL